MKKSSLFLVFFIMGMVTTSGCMQPESTGSTMPVTTIPATHSTILPLTVSPTQGSSPIVTAEPIIVVPETSLVTEQSTRIASDNPYLENLQIRKRTFEDSIPNCTMQEAFPAIVNDPQYGIQQPQPKISAISLEEYEKFLREYTAGKTENTRLLTISRCIGTSPEPLWNFIELQVILDPTNVRPANYTISQDVRSDGDIVAQIRTTRTLVIDHQIRLVSYIPLRTDELDLVDHVGVTFTRLSD
jgi:hypothetical protein